MKCLSLIFGMSMWLIVHQLHGQVQIQGKVMGEEGPISGALVLLKSTYQSTLTDAEGNFKLSPQQTGTQLLEIRFVGYKSLTQVIDIQDKKNQTFTFQMVSDVLGLDDVVVSATRYATSKTEASVLVNTLNQKVLNNTHSNNLAEGLNFQTGVRIETNCQNCGFTQVRMNGLEGAYSQILVNSRPVFSALMAVYGLEQIPTFMVDRVEIIKSGGSALFGSNAIAGTINIITKEPVLNAWEAQSQLASVQGRANQWRHAMNGTFVSDELDYGATIFAAISENDPFDANGDGFTELVKMKNQAIGGKLFYKLSAQTQINLDFNYINEFRRGGDRLQLAPEFTDITEQLEHQIGMGGVSIDHFFNQGRDKLSGYASIQKTIRDSYYGGLGGGRTQADSVLAANAFGRTDDRAQVIGTQWNHFFNLKHMITLGLESQLFKTTDEIPGYGRKVDQEVNMLGSYAQWEWQIAQKLKLMNGLRWDRSEVEGLYQLENIEREVNNNFQVLSPRFTFLYDVNEFWQMRGGYARGFRAPQAFNEDMHISFAGGEPLFVLLSNDLIKETSDALSASLAYHKTVGNTQIRASMELFRTALHDPFVQVNTGRQLTNGSFVEEVRNGAGAVVEGVNWEYTYAKALKYNVQGGFTLQKARFNEAQVIFEPELDGKIIESKDFMRTPNLYGFFNLNYVQPKHWELAWSNVLTGGMKVPEILQESGQTVLRQTGLFWDSTIKITRQIELGNHLHLDIAWGVQNLFNSYQDDFQSGPLRDADYIYGPARPRTYFISIKIGNRKFD